MQVVDLGQKSTGPKIRLVGDGLLFPNILLDLFRSNALLGQQSHLPDISRSSIPRAEVLVDDASGRCRHGGGIKRAGTPGHVTEGPGAARARGLSADHIGAAGRSGLRVKVFEVIRIAGRSTLRRLRRAHQIAASRGSGIAVVLVRPVVVVRAHHPSELVDTADARRLIAVLVSLTSARDGSDARRRATGSVIAECERAPIAGRHRAYFRTAGRRVIDVDVVAVAVRDLLGVPFVHGRHGRAGSKSLRHLVLDTVGRCDDEAISARVAISPPALSGQRHG
ncbi:hypothetical protein D3C72_1092970 [compost metagenome]